MYFRNSFKKLPAMNIIEQKLEELSREEEISQLLEERRINELNSVILDKFINIQKSQATDKNKAKEWKKFNLDFFKQNSGDIKRLTLKIDGEYLKKELGIDEKYIDKLSNQDLLKILSIKEAEISCGRKKYESDEEMQKALKVETKKCEDVNLTGYKPAVGFVQDFGNLFLNSFSSQQHGKFFAPLSHRGNVEKTTQDDELQNLNAFKKDKLLQIDGKGKDIEMTDMRTDTHPPHDRVSTSQVDKLDKGASIEMTEINRKHDKTFVVTGEHHFREDIIHERDTKNGEKTIAK
jgi:hypothetical protein